MNKIILIVVSIIVIITAQDAFAVKCVGDNPSSGADSRVVFSWDALPVSPDYSITQFSVACLPKSTRKDSQLWYDPANTAATGAASPIETTITAFGDQFCRVYYSTSTNDVGELSAQFGYTCTAPDSPPPVLTFPAPNNPNAVVHP